LILLLRLTKRYLVGAAVLAATLALAPPAAAHSTLVSTAPARDRVIERSPKHVLLHFDEPVETAIGSITVYDGEGEPVDAGKITRPSPESVQVAIKQRLERGTYTVAWRVISADSDPINGAWVFHVKEPGEQPAGVAAQVLEDTPFTTSVFYLGGRFLDFVLLLACVGGVAALVFALRDAAAPVRRRLLAILAGLAGGLTVVALVELGLQGAAAAGEDLGYGFQWDVISSVSGTRFGDFALARAGLAAALCVVALIVRRGVGTERREGANGRPQSIRFGRRRAETVGGPGGAPIERRPARSEGRTSGTMVEPSRLGAHGDLSHAVVARQGAEADGRSVSVLGAVMLLLAAGLVFTPGLSGHASVIGLGSVVADAAHVQAAAVWTGGLAFVVAGLLLARADRWPLAATAVPRFSTTAVISVAVLLVAGAINGYLQVRALRGLWQTEYGVLLLIKIGLVLPLLAMGAYNNRFAVPRLRAQIASRVERRRFLRFAAAELAVMVAVVGVTAALVNAPPARTEISMHQETKMELRLGPMRADMEVMPGEVGRNEIHLEFTKGRPAEVRVSALLESKDIGPLRYRARRGMEPGAYVVKRANLAPGGEWELRVEARRGEFDLFTDTVHMTIGGEM
jgi:copper transport protein